MPLQIAVPKAAPKSCQLRFGGSGSVPERNVPVVRLLDDIEDRSEGAVPNAHHAEPNGEEGEVVVSMLVEPSDGGPMGFLEFRGDPNYGSWPQCRLGR